MRKTDIYDIFPHLRLDGCTNTSLKARAPHGRHEAELYLFRLTCITISDINGDDSSVISVSFSTLMVVLDEPAGSRSVRIRFTQDFNRIRENFETRSCPAADFLA